MYGEFDRDFSYRVISRGVIWTHGGPASLKSLSATGGEGSTMYGEFDRDFPSQDCIELGKAVIKKGLIELLDLNGLMAGYNMSAGYFLLC